MNEPLSPKQYRCLRCFHVRTETTNHYGKIYAPCPNCNWKKPTEGNPAAECLDPLPEGWVRPSDWIQKKLGDLVQANKNRQSA